jgi:hypothetical protein
MKSLRKSIIWSTHIHQSLKLAMRQKRREKMVQGSNSQTSCVAQLLSGFKGQDFEWKHLWSSREITIVSPGHTLKKVHSKRFEFGGGKWQMKWQSDQTKRRFLSWPSRRIFDLQICKCLSIEQHEKYLIWSALLQFRCLHSKPLHQSKSSSIGQERNFCLKSSLRSFRSDLNSSCGAEFCGEIHRHLICLSFVEGTKKENPKFVGARPHSKQIFVQVKKNIERQKVSLGLEMQEMHEFTCCVRISRRNCASLQRATVRFCWCCCERRVIEEEEEAGNDVKSSDFSWVSDASEGEVSQLNRLQRKLVNFSIQLVPSDKLFNDFLRSNPRLMWPNTSFYQPFPCYPQELFVLSIDHRTLSRRRM